MGGTEDEPEGKEAGAKGVGGYPAPAAPEPAPQLPPPFVHLCVREPNKRNLVHSGGMNGDSIEVEVYPEGMNTCTHRSYLRVSDPKCDEGGTGTALVLDPSLVMALTAWLESVLAVSVVHPRMVRVT